MSNQKHCPGCDRDLDLADFSWKNMTGGIRQVWCKRCLKEANRAHYLNNTETYMDRAIQRNKRVNAENKQKLLNYLQEHPCIDCGCSDIRVLEFDHVRDEKVGNIAALLTRGVPWSTIAAEIAKCDVRCANCHRIQTIERGQWWRFDLME